MAAPEQFFDTGYPVKHAFGAARVSGGGTVRAVGVKHAFGSARVSGGGSVRASGYATHGATEAADHARLKQGAAAVAFAWLYLTVPAETVDRAAGWATVIALLVLLHDRSK